MDEAVEQRIGERWISELGVPYVDGKLTATERGAMAVTVLQDFQQIPSLHLGRRTHQEIIQNQQVEAGKTAQEFGVAAIGASERQFIEQATGSVVADSVALAEGGLSERARDVGLAGAGGSDDQDASVVLDETTGAELSPQGLVQLATPRKVDILDAGLGQTELGLAKPPRNALVVLRQRLGVDQPRRRSRWGRPASQRTARRRRYRRWWGRCSRP